MTGALVIDLKDPFTDANFNVLGTTQLDFVENGMFIENLMGGAISGQTLSGNWLNNTIVGNDGADSINGEMGDDFLANTRDQTRPNIIDTLTGGAGNDIFSLRDYDDGASALYADEVFNNIDLVTVFWDASFAYITDFTGSDTRLLPTILPDLNGDGQAATRFVTTDINDPFTLNRTRGLYIEDRAINQAGVVVSTYNLIAVGDNL
jgi:hypothetical protein